MRRASGDEDTEVLLPTDDDEIRVAIAQFRNDWSSRFIDGTRKSAAAMLKRKAAISSLPKVIMLMTLSGRASFLYDYGSDGQVAYALITGGNPWWGGFGLLFMAIPYLVLLVILHKVAQRKLGALFSHRGQMITVVWILFGIPALLVLDVYLHMRFLCTLPDDVQVGLVHLTGVEVFHYMELRKIVEFLEGIGQIFIQGYIWIRLLNPGGVFPDVDGISVNPWMLLLSIAFSTKGVIDAASFVTKMGKRQMNGDYIGFLKKMAALGEGLVPSVIYEGIDKQRLVVVAYDLASIKQYELRELGRTIRDSSVLEDLSFTRLEFLVELKGEPWTIENFFDDIFKSPCLKSLALGTKPAEVPAWQAELFGNCFTICS